MYFIVLYSLLPVAEMINDLTSAPKQEYSEQSRQLLPYLMQLLLSI